MVINGIGNHPPTQTLEAITEPLLARMRAERVLQDATAIQVGDADEPGGKFDAIDVRYTRSPRDQTVRRLLIVEGRWQGLYRKADERKMSAWIYARQAGMILEIVKYLARSWGGLLLSASFIAMSGTAIWLAGSNPEDPKLGVTLIALGVLVLVGLALLDAPLELPKWATLKDRSRISRPSAVVLTGIGLGLAVWGVSLIMLSDPWQPPWIVAFSGALLISAGSSFSVDVEDFWNTSKGSVGIKETSLRKLSALIKMSMLSPVFLVYTSMRAFIVIGALVAIAVFWILVPVIRLLASLPFTSRFSWWIFGKFETALYTTGFADMESVLNNHVSATAMRARLRNGLRATMANVKPGRPITVVVHSGGAPSAWELLSSDSLREELKSNNQGHRFHFLTVAPGLNWARRGANDRNATRIDQPLVRCGPALQTKTKWLNVYSTWDPTPHGPLKVDEEPFRIDGECTWQPLLGPDPDDAPARPPGDADPNGVKCGYEAQANIQVRNLGAPVREEHREYWHNQEQVVPLLGFAIDKHMEWSRRHTEPRWRNYWASVRLLLVSSLVRVRLVLVACVVAILILWFHDGDPFQALLATPYDFAYKQVDLPIVPSFRLSDILDGDLALKAACKDSDFQTHNAETCSQFSDASGQISGGSGPVNRFLVFFSVHDNAGAILTILSIALLAYLVMNVYTNLFWAQLARGPLPYGDGGIEHSRGFIGPERVGDRFKFKWVSTFFIVVVVPTIISSTLFLFNIPFEVRVAVVSLSLIVGLFEFGALWRWVLAARSGNYESLPFKCELGRRSSKSAP
ncbi:MAG: hypothetical protein AB7J35_01410 [Dehalococcoidia bacterium]